MRHTRATISGAATAAVVGLLLVPLLGQPAGAAGPAASDGAGPGASAPAAVEATSVEPVEVTSEVTEA